MVDDSDLDLRARARRWADGDVDLESRAEIERLLEQPDLAATDLADRFDGGLVFGTAGLRGLLGAGPNRMNRAVALRTTQGLGTYLDAHVEEAQRRGVVVGYDARTLSREMAEDVAACLAALGFCAHFFEAPVPTPLVAFAVVHLRAAAGVVITASHNPAEYNGYKVFWKNGAQIVPPVDAGIAAAIADSPLARDVPRLELVRARAEGRVTSVAPRVVDAYVEALRAREVHPGGDRAISIVYTPLHGVGGALVQRVLAESGFTDVSVVPEQASPDPKFPTVAFPNPEEPGALDLALAHARARGAKLVLASDPDADRLAVAVPASAPLDGHYVQLTGNDLGVLLGHYLLTQEPAHPGPRAVLATIVSSPLLGVIAAQLGVHYEETLTGFKWIVNRAMELEGEGSRFVFGYEEALGYAIGTVVRDKDGIGAARLVAELAVWLAGQGRTLLQELEAIHRRYGLFVSGQINVPNPPRRTSSRSSDVGPDDGATSLTQRFRALPVDAFAPFEVIAVRDYARQERVALGNPVPGIPGRLEPGRSEPGRSEPGRTEPGRSEEVTRLPLPPSEVVAFELALPAHHPNAGRSAGRLIVRPSGTEPKTKLYIDLRESIDPGEPLAAAEHRAADALASLTTRVRQLAQ